jgi:NAD(P)-dependent dehydrogenase (short-subunit alcohol dehydrogenase family)
MKDVAGVLSYSVSDWGLHGLTKTAAIRFSPVDICVNTLMP